MSKELEAARRGQDFYYGLWSGLITIAAFFAEYTRHQNSLDVPGPAATVQLDIFEGD